MLVTGALSGGEELSDGSGNRAFGPRVDDVRSWLHEQALPFWIRAGVDGQYGFVEHLNLEAEPAHVAYKRLRVQARQTYVFSHASLVGFPGALEAAENGWRFMREHGWLREGGWARRLGREGGVVDATLDLYDQAFALLAIAWWVKASGDAEATTFADRTLDAIDARLPAACGAGWLSDAGNDAALLQNPHMHLLEGLLAVHDATGEARFESAAACVVNLFESVMFDQATGTLAEYYDNEWRRAGGEAGRIVEPGHHYEWVWLLHEAARVVPGSVSLAEPLFRFAERFGSDPETGLIYDEILDDGSVRKRSHRSWPHAEALKAHLARFEHGGSLDAARTAQVVDNLFAYYLSARVPGTWIDQLDARRRPKVDKIPASTLYHLFMAFSELLRLEPKLREAGATG
jgi:mannose/cellobiose epimerase-like protein (N-acyl-D-glucosamine 2-epimerase family)